MNEQELKQAVEAAFAVNPGVDQFHVIANGNCFARESDARFAARSLRENERWVRLVQRTPVASQLPDDTDKGEGGLTTPDGGGSAAPDAGGASDEAEPDGGAGAANPASEGGTGAEAVLDGEAGSASEVAPTRAAVYDKKASRNK